MYTCMYKRMGPTYVRTQGFVKVPDQDVATQADSDCVFVALCVCARVCVCVCVCVCACYTHCCACLLCGASRVQVPALSAAVQQMVMLSVEAKDAATLIHAGVKKLLAVEAIHKAMRTYAFMWEQGIQATGSQRDAQLPCWRVVEDAMKWGTGAATETMTKYWLSYQAWLAKYGPACRQRTTCIQCNHKPVKCFETDCSPLTAAMLPPALRTADGRPPAAQGTTSNTVAPGVAAAPSTNNTALQAAPGTNSNTAVPGLAAMAAALGANNTALAAALACQYLGICQGICRMQRVLPSLWRSKGGCSGER